MTKITLKLFKKAIIGTDGNYSNIAKTLNVVRSAVTKYLQKHPELLDDIEDEREQRLDANEDVMRKIIEMDDSDDVKITALKFKAAQFMLSKLGKKRGYVETSEIDLKDERTRIIIEQPHDDNNKLGSKFETRP